MTRKAAFELRARRDAREDAQGFQRVQASAEANARRRTPERAKRQIQELHARHHGPNRERTVDYLVERYKLNVFDCVALDDLLMVCK